MKGPPSFLDTPAQETVLRNAIYQAMRDTETAPPPDHVVAVRVTIGSWTTKIVAQWDEAHSGQRQWVIRVVPWEGTRRHGA